MNSPAINVATANREWMAGSTQRTSDLGSESANDQLWRDGLSEPHGTTVTSVKDFERPSTMVNRETRPRRNPAVLLAEWSGAVLTVEESFFSATLSGITGEGVQGEQEDAEIPVSDISKSDLELLRPGNFFRLCVMLEIEENGQPRRYTQVVFRRLPAYRVTDLNLAAERGDELHRALRVE